MCQYNNIYKTKNKVKTEDREKKNVATVATVLHGTVATVKKKRQSGSIKWNCRCTVRKHCTCIRAFIYKIRLIRLVLSPKKKKLIRLVYIPSIITI